MFTQYARETIGTPFQHQGRLCGVGLDCAGVITHVFTRAGLDFNDARGYARSHRNDSVKKILDSQSILESVSDLQDGHILLMQFQGEPQHIAFFTGETIIHSYESLGRVVEHRLDDKWHNRIVKIYRIKQ